MLLDAQKSCLIQVDMQDKLLPFIHMHEELISQCLWMLEVAALLEIPTLITEQYPEGLGSTFTSLHSKDNTVACTKTQFSCAANKDCMETILKLNREQVVLTGIETHVCVLQTAFGLQKAGKEVFVVANATESRRMQDKVLAIDRMQFAGIHIISAEMALFEWCRDSKHPKFKELSQRFLQKK